MTEKRGAGRERGQRRKEEVRGRRDDGEERSREGERAEEEQESERERSGARRQKDKQLARVKRLEDKLAIKFVHIRFFSWLSHAPCVLS